MQSRAERTGVLDGHRVDAVFVEHLRDQTQRLGDARHDDEVGGVGFDPTVPGDPVRDGEPQSRSTGWMSVPEG